MSLYRRSSLQASLALVLVCILGLTAATAQRRKPHKLRATALLDFTGDASGVMTPRVTPITILDEGSFHDASIYKATPRPMALDDGVVYEAQRTGQPVGYVTVVKATKKEDFWTALGRWQPLSSTSKVQASTPPAGALVNSADSRPILHRAGSNSPEPSAPAPASPTPGSSSTSPAPDDRPVPHRPAGDASTQATPSPAAAPSPASATAAPEPEPEDPNRPTLRHRAPPSRQEQRETAQPEPATSAQQPASAAATPKLPTFSPSTQPATHGLAAVSDAQSGDSRSFEFVWKEGEEAQMEAKMRRLALAQLPRESPPLAEKSLANVVIRSFDLDLSNDAVMVLTAEVPPSPVEHATRTQAKAGGKASTGSRNAPAPGVAPAQPVSRYVTVIARVDIDGNPQKLSASVTDASRLDVAPRLELIDAVDVNGDGLGELLFREYDFDQKSFIIYGVGRGAVTKVFEGASQPLK
jgi:hypothetical protein